MVKIVYTTQFKKDIKRLHKRGYDLALLEQLIEQLSSGAALPESYQEHRLSGNWQNYRECYIQPDWLLIYKIEPELLILTLVRSGSHSDLF